MKFQLQLCLRTHAMAGCQTVEWEFPKIFMWLADVFKRDTRATGCVGDAAGSDLALGGVTTLAPDGFASIKFLEGLCAPVGI